MKKLSFLFFFEYLPSTERELSDLSSFALLLHLKFFIFALMKLLTSISFSFLFLIQGVMPNLDICYEFQKLPNLFEHYQEHKECFDNSFFEFLVDDYLDIDKNSVDATDHHGDKDHENLPFQGSHQCHHVCVFYLETQNFPLTVSHNSELAQPNYYNPIFTSQFQDSPFQPPKV